jgi:mono/diheme cytochrome c family protein
MPRRAVLNLILLVLAAVTLGSGWALRWDPAKPNYEYFPDMAHSPRYNAFSPNPVLPNRQTLQPPVPGTIPRGLLPLGFAAGPQEAARAGAELHSPFPLNDPTHIARGAFLFANFCQHCHGAGGLGDGPVAKRGFPPPPSLLAAHARSLPDGQIFHILTFGQGNMPAHASQIARGDRWNLVAYVRSLQRQNPLPPPAPAAPQPAAAPKLGGQP